jgi:hypothetical protein
VADSHIRFPIKLRFFFADADKPAGIGASSQDTAIAGQT